MKTTLWDLNMVRANEPPGDTSLHWDDEEFSLVLKCAGTEVTVTAEYLVDLVAGQAAKLSSLSRVPPRPSGCGGRECEITPGDSEITPGCSCLGGIGDRWQRQRLRAALLALHTLYDELEKR